MSLFKKWTFAESVNDQKQAKTSAARKIGKAVQISLPELKTELEVLMPKKTPVYILNCQNKLSLTVCQNKILFFQAHKEPHGPTLRVIHEFPHLLAKAVVDKGAIPFVLRGVDIVAQGFLNPGGVLPEGLKKGDFVAIYGEGMEHACAIGRMTLSTEEIRAAGSGYCVKNLHCLGDGLWDQTTDDAGIMIGGQKSRQKNTSKR
jgi:PUA domain protein